MSNQGKDPSAKIGNFLWQVRQRSGDSCSTIARECDTNRETLRLWEQGQREIPLSKLKSYAEALEVDLYDVLDVAFDLEPERRRAIRAGGLELPPAIRAVVRAHAPELLEDAA